MRILSISAELFPAKSTCCFLTLVLNNDALLVLDWQERCQPARLLFRRNVIVVPLTYAILSGTCRHSKMPSSCLPSHETTDHRSSCYYDADVKRSQEHFAAEQSFFDSSRFFLHYARLQAALDSERAKESRLCPSLWPTPARRRSGKRNSQHRIENVRIQVRPNCVKHVDNEFPQVFVDRATRFDCFHYRSEAVVEQHHVGCLTATSVPESPIAMPISASFNEGASFAPSPVTATISPNMFQRSDYAELLFRRNARKHHVALLDFSIDALVVNAFHVDAADYLAFAA